MIHKVRVDRARASDAGQRSQRRIFTFLKFALRMQMLEFVPADYDKLA